MFPNNIYSQKRIFKEISNIYERICWEIYKRIVFILVLNGNKLGLCVNLVIGFLAENGLSDCSTVLIGMVYINYHMDNFR